MYYYLCLSTATSYRIMALWIHPFTPTHLHSLPEPLLPIPLSPFKGCTHRVMILFNGAIDSHQKEQSKAIAQWEHLPFAIFAIFNVKKQLKVLVMVLDQYLTCLICLLRWPCFPIKISRIVQWVHLFSMGFNDFSTILPYFVV